VIDHNKPRGIGGVGPAQAHQNKLIGSFNRYPMILFAPLALGLTDWPGGARLPARRRRSSLLSASAKAKA
jgi:hypothetical protein